MTKFVEIQPTDRLDGHKDIFYTLVNTYLHIHAPEAKVQCYTSKGLNDPIFKAIITHPHGLLNKRASYAIKESAFKDMPLSQLNNIMLSLANEVKSEV